MGRREVGGGSWPPEQRAMRNCGSSCTVMTRGELGGGGHSDAQEERGSQGKFCASV
jgi:hypothetical protein